MIDMRSFVIEWAICLRAASTKAQPLPDHECLDGGLWRKEVFPMRSQQLHHLGYHRLW
jgi:hypothetical protein